MNPATRVLIVDDNEAVLARAGATLSPGCTVVGMVRDASVVLEAVRTLQPDVVVLDISLTSMTGFELAQSLQADGPAVALVFLSAYEEEDLIEAAQDAGAVGYVIKRRLATDLPIAVREAHAGRRFVSPVKL